MMDRTVSHYRILDKLGEGGMGVVYKAHDTKLDREVALKFLSADALSQDVDRTRFIHEAKAAASLHHPHICTIHEIDEHDGRLFMAMAYVEGQSLRDRIAEGPMPVAEAIDVVMEVCSGLHAAHMKGIVHRDIKPANVMRDATGRALLMDFGLAQRKDTTRLTRTGTTLGTVAYMSPEQLRGEELDRRADVWALGVMLFELITGRLPFRGDVEPALMYSIMNEDPESVAMHVADVPAGIEGIIAKALERDRDNRYSSAEALRADLKELRNDPEAFPAGVPRRRRRMSSRQRVLTAVVPALIIAGAAVMFVKFGMDGEAKASVAVLPCINGSGDADQEYLSDGLTEDLIVQLSSIDGFRVLNPITMFKYKGTEKGSREIAEELQADVLLRTRMRMDEDRVELSVQLIDPETDEVTWGAQYDEHLSAIKNVQRALTLEIARALNVTPAADKKDALEQEYKVEPEAYRAYQRGRELMRARTGRRLLMAVDYFKQAIALDSTWAPAHAGLAEAYFVSSNPYYWRGSGVDRAQELGIKEGEFIERALETARHALSLDPHLAEAHMVLGDYPKATELNPNLAWAYYYWSLATTSCQRPDLAVERARKAVSLDPGSLLMRANLGRSLFLVRDYERAEKEILAGIDLDPEHTAVWAELLSLRISEGRYLDAMEPMTRFVELEGGNPEAFAPVLRAAAGEIPVDERVLSVVGAVEKIYGLGWAATCYTILGEYDRAVECFEEMMRLGEIPYRGHLYPVYDALSSNPRMVEIHKRIAELAAEKCNA